MTLHVDDDDRQEEPHFAVTCSECGCEYHGGDAGIGCPSCGGSSSSYASADASEWMRWAE